MANTRELKERMASIEETKKITNAMYLISSSKMKAAKEKLAKTEPFFFAMQKEISRILTYWPDLDNPFFDTRKKTSPEDRKKGIIIITADKGLAGAYNHNAIKTAEEMMLDSANNKLFILGEVGRHYFAKKHNHMEVDLTFNYTVQNPTLHRSRQIAETMLELFLSKELDEVHIVYTKMENAMSAVTEHIQLLPLKKGTFDNDENSSSMNRNITFYPTADDVMDSVVPNYINGIIYGCLVESYYSEHNARMNAMQNATDSAEDMLKELSMTYNRVRQADITQELTEVVAGANAQQRK